MVIFDQVELMERDTLSKIFKSAYKTYLSYHA